MSTSGPVYFGALVCFLFVLGMFVIRNPIKWWLFAASVFFVFLALGRYFDLFNDVVFHHLPLYNKFRTVEMALVIPGLIFRCYLGIAGVICRKCRGISPEERLFVGIGTYRRNLSYPVADAVSTSDFPVSYGCKYTKSVSGLVLYCFVER